MIIFHIKITLVSPFFHNYFSFINLLIIYPMGYRLWENVYIDKLLFIIYDLEDNKKLQEELNTLLRNK